MDGLVGRVREEINELQDDLTDKMNDLDRRDGRFGRTRCTSLRTIGRTRATRWTDELDESKDELTDALGDLDGLV